MLVTNLENLQLCPRVKIIVTKTEFSRGGFADVIAETKHLYEIVHWNLVIQQVVVVVVLKQTEAEQREYGRQPWIYERVRFRKHEATVESMR